MTSNAHKLFIYSHGLVQCTSQDNIDKSHRLFSLFHAGKGSRRLRCNGLRLQDTAFSCSLVRIAKFLRIIDARKKDEFPATETPSPSIIYSNARAHWFAHMDYHGIVTTHSV